MIVEEPTWRWMSAISPNPPPFDVLEVKRIGSREVILIANPTGKDLMVNLPDS